MRELDDITSEIINVAINIHRDLGLSMLESVYELVMAKVLTERGLRVERQVPVSFEYEGLKFENAFRIDLLVEQRVIVELKSVEKNSPAHSKQVLSYLRLMDLKLGLVLNFGKSTLREGLERVVNDLPPSASSRLRVNQ